MSILGSSSSNSGNMGAPLFHEFKKQASFFLKEKIKTARLVLTDVTVAELLTEEATSGNPSAPDTPTLKIISRAAFEVDDYWRIVEILHKRLARFDRKNWRLSYNGLIVLEHLLTHGPESVAEEFQNEKDIIEEMGNFQHIDEKGFNWGLNVRKKSERISKLLEKGPLLKEERDRSRKLTRGIEGFGSFCQRISSQGILQESDLGRRCNSQFNDHGNEENQFPTSKNEDLVSAKKMEDLKSWSGSSEGDVVKNSGVRMSFKGNMAPNKEILTGDFHVWELNSLLGDEKDDDCSVFGEENHPFNESEHQTSVSLLSTTDQLLQAC